MMKLNWTHSQRFEKSYDCDYKNCYACRWRRCNSDVYHKQLKDKTTEYWCPRYDKNASPSDPCPNTSAEDQATDANEAAFCTGLNAHYVRVTTDVDNGDAIVSVDGTQDEKHTYCKTQAEEFVVLCADEIVELSGGATTTRIPSESLAGIAVKSGLDHTGLDNSCEAVRERTGIKTPAQLVIEEMDTPRTGVCRRRFCCVG